MRKSKSERSKAPSEAYATTYPRDPYTSSNRPEPGRDRGVTDYPRRESRRESTRTVNNGNGGWAEADDSNSRRDSRRSSRPDRKQSSRAIGDDDARLAQNQPYGSSAASYYGDQGESVASQPGVRPSPPSILYSADQAHLLTPSVDANPPPEPSSQGQVGSAASFYPANNNGAGSDYQSGPTRPDPRPGNQPNGSSGQQAAGIPTGPYRPRPDATASYANSSSNPPPASDMASHSGSHNYGAAAAGLAGAAAAGAYFLNQHHQHEQESQSQGQYSQSQQNAGFYTNAANPNAGLGQSQSPYARLQQRPRQRRRGPIGKVVNWLRDPDGVARYEEYSEAVGVCRYCFDPNSSPLDAPRKHHYHGHRPSSSRYGSSTRVDKAYRYSSSDDGNRKSAAIKKAAAGGLAGLAAAKIGDAIYKHRNDFDDTYSVQSGQPASRSRVSFADNQDGNWSRKNGTYRPTDDDRRLERRDSDRKSRRDDGVYEKRSSRRRDSSSESRSRTPSPSRRGKGYYSKRISPQHSYVDLTTTNPGPLGLGRFFSPSTNKRKGKKSKGLFHFANSSSSSSDADLAFGEGTVRRRDSNRKSKEGQGRHSSSAAALAGLAATGVALAAESDRRKRRAENEHYADGKAGRYAPQRNRVKLQDHETTADGEHEAWEDVSDDDDKSSLDTALAYGGGLSANQSRESLNQGTNKWDWRWRDSGNRRKYRTESPSAGIAAAAGAGKKSGNQSSIPPMQHVDPVPTSDSAMHRYSTAGQVSPMSATPAPQLYASSDPVPLQQPQPVVPIGRVPGAFDGAIEDNRRTERDQDRTSRSRRDSSPAKLPSRDTRNSVSFALPDDHSDTKRQQRPRREEEQRRRSTDPAILYDNTPSRDNALDDADAEERKRAAREAEIEAELERLYAEDRPHVREHNEASAHADHQDPHVIEITPGRRKKYESPFDSFVYRPFGIHANDDPSSLPWPVPALELETPTPEGSRPHTPRAVSPLPDPSKERDIPKEDIKDQPRRRSSRVKWGDDDVNVYEAMTPEHEPTDFIADSPQKATSPTTEEPPAVRQDDSPPSKSKLGRAWTIDDGEAAPIEGHPKAEEVEAHPSIPGQFTTEEHAPLAEEVPVGPRPSKSERRRIERAAAAPPGGDNSSIPSEHPHGRGEERSISAHDAPSVPGTESVFDYLVDGDGKPLPPASALGAAAASAVSTQHPAQSDATPEAPHHTFHEDAAKFSKPKRASSLDESRFDKQHSKSKSDYSSDPEHPDHSKKGREHKSAKSGMDSAVEDAVAVGVAAAVLGNDFYDSEKRKRKAKRASETHDDADARSVASAPAEGRSGSSRKSSKRESKAYDDNDDNRSIASSHTDSNKSKNSREKRSSGDREEVEKRKKRRSVGTDLDDAASVASESTRKSRRDVTPPSERPQTVDSRDQSVDDGFVSAEESSAKAHEHPREAESFLAERPDIPKPMDIPMATDGVSGLASEGPTIQPHGSQELPRGAAHEEPLREAEHETPAEPSTPESRRISALRTQDLPSSPVTSSSPTSVPFFRRTPRASSSSPGASPASPRTTAKSRQSRPNSTEFRSSKEIRPLYLVQKTQAAKSPAPEVDEDLPSLPSSKTSSAHPSTEDLRAMSKAAEAEDFFPSKRISPEQFRERGRRHSYSYWHDDEPRRQSPGYLDSRSATPTPANVQERREAHRKKAKPKYEFHSPSELLQDPALPPQSAQPDTVPDRPPSPLPSVVGPEQDEDSISPRSTPAPTRTNQQSDDADIARRKSRSRSRSRSRRRRDTALVAGLGIVAGSALGLVTHELKSGHDSKDSKTDDVSASHSRHLEDAISTPLPQDEDRDLELNLKQHVQSVMPERSDRASAFDAAFERAVRTRGLAGGVTRNDARDGFALKHGDASDTVKRGLAESVPTVEQVGHASELLPEHGPNPFGDDFEIRKDEVSVPEDNATPGESVRDLEEKVPAALPETNETVAETKAAEERPEEFLMTPTSKKDKKKKKKGQTSAAREDTPPVESLQESTEAPKEEEPEDSWAPATSKNSKKDRKDKKRKILDAAVAAIGAAAVSSVLLHGDKDKDAITEPETITDTPDEAVDSAAEPSTRQPAQTEAVPTPAPEATTTDSLASIAPSSGKKGKGKKKKSKSIAFDDEEDAQTPGDSVPDDALKHEASAYSELPPSTSHHEAPLLGEADSAPTETPAQPEDVKQSEIAPVDEPVTLPRKLSKAEKRKAKKGKSINLADLPDDTQNEEVQGAPAKVEDVTSKADELSREVTAEPPQDPFAARHPLILDPAHVASASAHELHSSPQHQDFLAEAHEKLEDFPSRPPAAENDLSEATEPAKSPRMETEAAGEEVGTVPPDVDDAPVEGAGQESTEPQASQEKVVPEEGQDDDLASVSVKKSKRDKKDKKDKKTKRKSFALGAFAEPEAVKTDEGEKVKADETCQVPLDDVQGTEPIFSVAPATLGDEAAVPSLEQGAREIAEPAETIPIETVAPIHQVEPPVDDDAPTETPAEETGELSALPNSKRSKKDKKKAKKRGSLVADASETASSPAAETAEADIGLAAGAALVGGVIAAATTKEREATSIETPVQEQEDFFWPPSTKKVEEAGRAEVSNHAAVLSAETPREAKVDEFPLAERQEADKDVSMEEVPEPAASLAKDEDALPTPIAQREDESPLAERQEADKDVSMEEGPEPAASLAKDEEALPTPIAQREDDRKVNEPLHEQEGLLAQKSEDVSRKTKKDKKKIRQSIPGAFGDEEDGSDNTPLATPMEVDDATISSLAPPESQAEAQRVHTADNVAMTEDTVNEKQGAPTVSTGVSRDASYPTTVDLEQIIGASAQDFQQHPNYQKFLADARAKASDFPAKPVESPVAVVEELTEPEEGGRHTTEEKESLPDAGEEGVGQEAPQAVEDDDWYATRQKEKKKKNGKNGKKGRHSTGLDYNDETPDTAESRQDAHMDSDGGSKVSEATRERRRRRRSPPPSPVEPTSKDRSSVVFQSTPERQHVDTSAAAASSPTTNREVEEAPISRDIFSPPPSNHPISPPKSPLQSIPEHPMSHHVSDSGGAMSRDDSRFGAKSLGDAKTRTSSRRNLRGALASSPDLPVEASSSRGPVDGSVGPDRDMAEQYEGYGNHPGSPMSPTRPPSITRRRSMQQIQDLQAKIDQLASENRALADAKITAERHLNEFHLDRNRSDDAHNEALQSAQRQLQERDERVAQLKQEIDSLAAEHEALRGQQVAIVDNHEQERSQWQESTRELTTLRDQHNQLSTGMEDIIRNQVDTAIAAKTAEIERLHGDLERARAKIRELQSQILERNTTSDDDVIVTRDEDYFEAQCQQLCQHVQQWVLRFSKFSDGRMCRNMSEVRDEKVADRFDSAILDGSNVDVYLADRVRRRDVFMSVVMTMIWEYVFTRYLFGMDRDQRQKLKQLEKQLSEVGPTSAVAHWRAMTLTLLSKREAFAVLREQDTEAVAREVYDTLAGLLPPPANRQTQILESLRNVMRSAANLSVEMRCQRAGYIMLPPLQPEYDTNGDLARKVYFNASLMNERSGETTSNEALEAERAVVRMVLFPLVVKKGGDSGGEDGEEIVVCPAQVLIAREWPRSRSAASGLRPSSRVASGQSQGNRSAVSLAASASGGDGMGAGEMI
ncbi:hypothetical protein DV736_g177, partial [Chaetothyriales sp. CBS 134916]